MTLEHLNFYSHQNTIKRLKRSKINENGKSVRMLPWRNVILTRMRKAVLFKTLILELMQSI